MDEGGAAKPVCAQEALDLLNCVTQSPSYDQDKCITLLNSSRQCVLAKNVKKFSLAGQEQETNPSGNKA